MDPQRQAALLPFFTAECAVAAHSQPTLDTMKFLDRSLVVGCAVGFGFFVLSLSSILMVMGDGTAPKFTHFMLTLNQLPFKIMEVRAPDSMLFLAAIFWGVLVALCVFIFSAIGSTVGSRR